VNVLVVNDPRMIEQLSRLGVLVVLGPFNIEALLTALRDVMVGQSMIVQALDFSRARRATVVHTDRATDGAYAT
jgi:hypothetical protein